MATPALPRFDGAEAWKALDADQRAAIGAIALEMVAGWYAQENAADPYNGSDPILRAAEHGDSALMESLRETFVSAFPKEVLEHEGLPRLPSRLGMICTGCGCTNDNACGTGCSWAEDNRCTACPAPVSLPEACA